MDNLSKLLLQTIKECKNGSIGKYIKDRLWNDGKITHVTINDSAGTIMEYMDESWMLQYLFSNDTKKQELAREYMKVHGTVRVTMGESAWLKITETYEEATNKTLNVFSNEKLSKYSWLDKKCAILKLIDHGYLKPLGSFKGIPDWITLKGLEKLENDHRWIMGIILTIIGLIIGALKYCLK